MSGMVTKKTSVGGLSVTVRDVEAFLYDEAALLDRWLLDEWLALFEEGATYSVPPADSDDDVDPASTLFYIADDYPRLVQRVKRLQKSTAHVEFPHSRCCRLISNVRILDGDDDRLVVESKFVTYRSKNGILEVYLGRHSYGLRVGKDGFRILSKRSQLDLNDIREQGKVSIIL